MGHAGNVIDSSQHQRLAQLVKATRLEAKSHEVAAGRRRRLRPTSSSPDRIQREQQKGMATETRDLVSREAHGLPPL
jgi:protein required for attachment to host cells